ncbi:MAG: ornithine cyclodeaminase family protein [Nitrososphaerales archaeon]
MTLLINNHEQESLLEMKDCLNVLEDAIKEEALGRAVSRNKSILHFPTDQPDLWYNYVSIEGGIAKTQYVAIRIRSDMERSVRNSNGSRVSEKYAVRAGSFCGLVLLYSAKNGELVAILNDGYLQHMRVGATYGLGAKYSSKKESRVLGLLGSGGMAEAQCQAYSLVRGIELVKVYSPSKAHRDDFATRMSKKIDGIRVEAVEGPEQAIRGSDIVAACTTSLEPVLRKDWVEDGMHLSEVTQFEIGSNTLPRIDRFVHYRTGIPSHHSAAASSVLPDVPSGTTPDQDFESKVDRGKVFSLHDVLLGKYPGRVNDSEVSLFFGEGTGVQFAAVGGRAYEEARKAGLGKELPAEWFLQTIKT